MKNQYLVLDLILNLQGLILKQRLNACLSQLSLGDEAKLTCIQQSWYIDLIYQQSWYIDLIYDHPEVFSLHDEDLRFCDQIKHTIPMMMDKTVYLAHCTILPQLQGKVCKCLDTWLQQGIIRPSQSPYASQVVVLQKKTGEIHLCVDYQKLKFHHSKGCISITQNWQSPAGCPQQQLVLVFWPGSGVPPSCNEGEWHKKDSI